MGKRRMFSLRIIDTARFLKMPIDSQVLYFHLGLRADDDGVVEAYPVMKMVGSTEDNIRVLVAKGFCTILNEDFVTYLNDWQEHNLIRADRKIDSIYKELLIKFNIDTVSPKPRADTKKLTGRPMSVNGRRKLSKVNIRKDKKNKEYILNNLREELKEKI